MKKTNKLLISVVLSSILLSTTFLNAKQLTSKEVVERIQSQQSGDEVVSQKVSLKDADMERGQVDDYRDAIIANYIVEFERENTPTEVGVRTAMVSDNIKKWEKEEAERIAREAELQMQEDQYINNSFYTRGYCSFLNEVEVSEIVSFAEVECLLDGIGNARLTLNIHPQHGAKALVAKAIHIIPDGIDQRDRLSVQQGVVLNGLRTGLNIASIVNDRKIERMLAASLLSVNTVATEESLKYMEALESSKQNEGSEVIPGSSGSAPIVVQTSNTAAPDTKDYLTVAGIQMVSSLVGIFGESMINDLPYLYKIEKGQRVYFDGLVDIANKEGQRGPIKFTDKGLINKTTQSIKVDKTGTVTFDTLGQSKDDTDFLEIEEEKLQSKPINVIDGYRDTKINRMKK